MSKELLETSEPHATLFRAVFKHFQESGSWPEVSRVQMPLRKMGNVRTLAAALGHDLVICESNTGGVCRLTLRGLALIDAAAPDLDRFVTTLRILAKKSIDGLVGENVLLSEIVQAMELTPLEFQRLGEVIHHAPYLWKGLGHSADGDLSITLADDIWYFEEISTLDEYFETIERMIKDQREAHRSEFPIAAYTPAQSPRRKGARTKRKRSSFVDGERVEELRAIAHQSFDLKRLIALCEELNTCAENECFFAQSMLTRAIIDHVPPVFGFQKFSEVASSYPGGRSFKQSMGHLERSARLIADNHLHAQIRRREVLPNATQVDFSRDLDVLLAEVVRRLSDA